MQAQQRHVSYSGQMPPQAFAVAAYINACHTGLAGLSYEAASPDASFNGLPTVQVRVRRQNADVAVYKMNLLQMQPHAPVVFSPLVITWAPDAPRAAGTGRCIISHCTGWIAGARREIFEGRGAMLTSGNLTAARAGAPFFTALGWNIVSAAKARPDPVLHDIAQRLAAATAPFRREGDEEISFAYTLVGAP